MEHYLGLQYNSEHVSTVQNVHFTCDKHSLYYTQLYCWVIYEMAAHSKIMYDIKNRDEKKVLPFIHNTRPLRHPVKLAYVR